MPTEVKSFKLIYFDIRGLAEPIRWMFAIQGVPFKDERIPLEIWPHEKTKYSRHVGQLPILYIDDILLTQVHACIRYVARQLGFNGANERQEARADEVTELIYDLRLCCVAYKKDSFESATPDIVRHTVFRDFFKEPSIAKKARMRKHLVEDHFPKYFTKFADLLEESGGEWVAGPVLTYADLCLANFLDVAETMVNPDILNDYPTLAALKRKVFAIPEVQQYIEATRMKTSMIGG